MIRNLLNFDENIEDELFETDEDLDFINWMELEGNSRISELSRQLRTFFNFKTIIICHRFSNHSPKIKRSDNKNIENVKNELSALIYQYNISLKKLKISKIENFTEVIKSILKECNFHQDNDLLVILNELKSLGNKIWKTLHLLSELSNIGMNLVYIASNIAEILSYIESIYFLPYSLFYNGLNLCYAQISSEISKLLKNADVKSNTNTKIGSKKVSLFEN